VKGKKAKKATSKFTIDASQPVADKVLDVAAFEKFLVDHIKVEGKTNNLGKNVTVTREDAKLTVCGRAEPEVDLFARLDPCAKPTFFVLVVFSLLSVLQVTAANLPFSKRYLKYLTKKFLKKSQLKDYMHVVANSKASYEIRYYKVAGEEEAA